MDELRALLYPLGFLSALLFGARVLTQWIQSERAQSSVSSPLFWQLSLAGNALALLHSLIQSQFPIACIQTINSIISWRNLRLFSPTTPAWMPRQMLYSCASALALLFLLFIGFHLAVDLSIDWARSPITPWHASENAAQLHPFWHAVGNLGFALFCSRFWIQWWYAEQRHHSGFPPLFWAMSLVGALCSSFYFFAIGDAANLIGPALGLIPYLRNLFFFSGKPLITRSS